jgi:hypothetical protein
MWASMTLDGVSWETADMVPQFFLAYDGSRAKSKPLSQQADYNKLADAP